MTERKQRLLQTPQGTEGIYLEEAFRHQQAASRINNLFRGWGYLPVETPLFDFFDIYQDMVSGKEKDIYRLIDREGDLLMLRSDITLFLAKQMGLLLSKADLPMRVFYSGAILRHQNQEDISKNEFFQTGIELIGKKGLNADMEVLVLLIDTFKLLDLKPRIHIGSREVINATLSGFPHEHTTEVLKTLSARDFYKLKDLLTEKLSGEKISFLMELFKFIGSRLEFISMLERNSYRLDKEEQTSIEYLISLTDTLEKLGLQDSFRIDISETGNQNYHTGIVFQGYLDGIDSAVTSGGRYDTLLKQFGFDTPSVGFSILLRKVENSMGTSFSLPPQIKIEEQDFITAYRKAEDLRKEGRIVII